MTEFDLFGLNREKRILESKVRSVFTPHQPIREVDLLLGREKEVSSIVQQLGTPGQHAILFGDRGVGKSSLANIASYLLPSLLESGRTVTKRCDSTDSFATIAARLLQEAGIDTSVSETTSSQQQTGTAGLKIPIVSAGVQSSRQDTTTRVSDLHIESPSWVAEQVKDLKVLYLVDEIDALSSDSDRKLLAEFVKQLSDSGSSLKLLLVGIAETAATLTAGHPSVSRCLKETHLGRLSESAMIAILDRGEKKLPVKFTPQAKIRISRVSSGFAHFVHLLALKAAEEAIGNGLEEITVSNVESATRSAVNDSEGTLKRMYMSACTSANTDEYTRILEAAASCSAEEFKASELRAKYAAMFGKEIKQPWLNNYFNKLVSDNGDRILRRIAKGVYRFSDPRMVSFVRITAIAKSQIIPLQSNNSSSVGVVEFRLDDTEN